MAQAARLSLRMQKELKLLLSDPPPGATFPYLSSESDRLTSSLTAIDAQIEGPKGTVYDNGYFHIKIQIPERYPFQPPIVTFATPIYHPNIDTGGRICLDILNLPPKGAWQPSLNISTVITSIGLLLSEPNPDDGLMREASREYKYNRQTFNQKARSMTEKYAKALSGGSSSSSNEGFLIKSNGCQGEKKAFKDEVSSEVSNLKQHGISRKLSLQSSGSTENLNDKRLADQSNSAPLTSQMEIEHKTESKYDPCYININDGKLSGMRRKLSLGASCQSQNMSSDEKNTTSFHDSSSPIPQTSQQMKRFGDGDFSCQDVGFDLGAKSLYCKIIPADPFNKMEDDHVDPSQMQQVTQPTITGFCHIVPEVSSLKSQAADCLELKPPFEDKNLVANGITIPSYKHRFSNKKLNLGHQEVTEKAREDNKENTPQVALHQPTREPNYQPCQLSLVSSSVTGKHVNGRPVCSKLNSSKQNQGFPRKLSLQPLKSLQANHVSNNEVDASDYVINQVREELEPPISSEVIVMDSEDEKENEELASSKLSLARRRLCLAGKRKAKA